MAFEAERNKPARIGLGARVFVAIPGQTMNPENGMPETGVVGLRAAFGALEVVSLEDGGLDAVLRKVAGLAKRDTFFRLDFVLPPYRLLALVAGKVTKRQRPHTMNRQMGLVNLVVFLVSHATFGANVTVSLTNRTLKAVLRTVAWIAES